MWRPPLEQRRTEDLKQGISELRGMRPWSPYYPGPWRWWLSWRGR